MKLRKLSSGCIDPISAETIIDQVFLVTYVTSPRAVQFSHWREMLFHETNAIKKLCVQPDTLMFRYHGIRTQILNIHN